MQTSTGGGIDSLRDEIERLRKEQSETMKLVTQMTSRFEKLEARVTALEGGVPASTPAKEVSEIVMKLIFNDVCDGS